MTTTLLNFRDLGGLATGDGRTVRHGVLFRSDDIGALAPEDWHALQADLRLAVAIDMRSGFEDELAEGARTVHGGVAIRRIPILDGSMVHAAESGELDLAEMYGHIVTDSGDAIAAGVNALVEATPGLVFCTAGKDRTGVLVAVLLEAIGVRRVDIVADYVRSDAAGPAIRERMYRRFGDRVPEVPEAMFRAPAPVIERVLDGLVERHGSAAGYLRDHGVAVDGLERLEATLLA